jgi:hypothetical protein
MELNRYLTPYFKRGAFSYMSDFKKPFKERGLEFCDTSYRKYTDLIERHKWLKIFGFLSAPIQGIALTGFLAFVHFGIDMLVSERVVKTLWWVGVVLFAFSSIRRYMAWKSSGSRQKIQFQWGLHFLILAFALVAYILYIPSKPQPFRHKENPETIRAFIVDNRTAPSELVQKGINLYGREEFSWSYICFEAALDTRRAALNQFTAYYIGDLLKIGRNQKAQEETEKVIRDIKEASQKGGVLADKDILNSFIECLNSAKSKLDGSQKDKIGNLADFVSEYYLISLTNSFPKK